MKEGLVSLYLCIGRPIDISHRHDRMIRISLFESSNWLKSTVGMDIAGVERPNQIGAMDFIFDATENGRSLKSLIVVDEFTRYLIAAEREL